MPYCDIFRELLTFISDELKAPGKRSRPAKGLLRATGPASPKSPISRGAQPGFSRGVQQDAGDVFFGGCLVCEAAGASQGLSARDRCGLAKIVAVCWLPFSLVGLLRGQARAAHFRRALAFARDAQWCNWGDNSGSIHRHQGGRSL